MCYIPLQVKTKFVQISTEPRRRPPARFVVLIVLCTLAGIRASVIYAEDNVDLRRGLIGYWPFDGDGKDHSGHKRDFDFVGNTSFVDGLCGKALEIAPDETPNSQKSYAVRSKNDPEFDFGKHHFTIQIWTKFKTLNGEQNILEKFDTDVGPGWTLLKKHPTYHDWQFYMGGIPSLDDDKTDPKLSEWQQLVVRRRASGTPGMDSLELHVDGNLVEGAHRDIASATAVNPSPRPLLLGIRYDDAKFLNQYHGDVDELAIWNRALTDDELEILRNKPCALGAKTDNKK